MRTLAVSVVALLLGVTTLVAAPSGDRQTLPEKFEAFAVSLGGPRSASGTARVEITITRWSTDAERQRLREALQTNQTHLVDVLRDLTPVGSIRTDTNLAYDLHYANERPGGDGGRRIFLATDRPISAWEAINRPRTIDYPFTFIELHMNNQGQGEGKLSLATKVIANDDIIQLEDYALQPVQLNQVHRLN